MPSPNQTSDQFWSDDQTQDSPFDRRKDCEGCLDYIGALEHRLTPELLSKPIGFDVPELKNHPGYQASAVGALEIWPPVTSFEFEAVDDATYGENRGWMPIVCSEVGEESDSSAFSSNHNVNIGQRFHDTEPSLTDVADDVFGLKNTRHRSAALHPEIVPQRPRPDRDLGVHRSRERKAAPHRRARNWWSPLDPHAASIGCSNCKEADHFRRSQ